MIKKFAVVLFVLSLIIVSPVAAQTTQTCVQVYGGGVVCGASAPAVQPVSTGLGDNIALIGGAFIFASGILLYLRKRVKQNFAK